MYQTDYHFFISCILKQPKPLTGSVEEDGTQTHLSLQPLSFSRQTYFTDSQPWGYAILDIKKNQHHLVHLAQITAGMNNYPFNIVQTHAISSAFR